MKKLSICLFFILFTLQNSSLAEQLILKCSGASITSEGVTKPLDSIDKIIIIDLDKKETYRSDHPETVNTFNTIITDNFFYEYNVDVVNPKTEKRLDFGALLQIRSINRLDGSLTIISKHNSSFTYERLRKELNKVNAEIKAQQDGKYITKKTNKYITKKHANEDFFVLNGTTEQELKKYNIVKRNVMSILNSKTRTIAKYQCKNEAYK